MHREKREMAGLLPLVLLSICCVSAAATKAESQTEIISTKPAAEEPSVQNQQQNFITDINSTLRDISAQLAELKVEVKQLQKQSEEQSATLKEQELQKNELEKLQQQFKQQQQQHQIQAAELVNIITKENIIVNQVEALRTNIQARQVAFSASLLASGSGHTGPFNTPTNLIFRNVIVNIGRAYNPMTGVFTAPVRGAYHFEFYIYGEGHPLHQAAASLMKNGQQICVAYEHQVSRSFQAANGATLLLEAGDLVFLRQWANTRVFDNAFHPTTFSGHLLFTI